MEQNIVNPDAIERVEKRPWNFKPVMVQVTPDMVKKFFLETPAAVDRLLDMMILKFPCSLESLLDESREDFEDFVRGC